MADCGALFISCFGADAWSTVDGRIEEGKRLFFFLFGAAFKDLCFWFLVPGALISQPTVRRCGDRFVEWRGGVDILMVEVCKNWVGWDLH